MTFAVGGGVGGAAVGARVTAPGGATLSDTWPTLPGCREDVQLVDKTVY